MTWPVFCVAYFFSVSMWQEGQLRFLFSMGLAGTMWLIAAGSILVPLAAAAPQAWGRLVQLTVWYIGEIVQLKTLECFYESSDMGAVPTKSGEATDKKGSLVQ